MSHQSDTETIQQIEDNYTQRMTAVNQRNQLLKKFLAAIKASPSFDEEDANAVNDTLSKLNNDDILKYRQLALNRLTVLKEFDDVLHFKESFPTLNAFFVKKQQEIMKVLSKSEQV